MLRNGSVTSSPQDTSRQETLTNEASSMSTPTTSAAIPNATSSPASADGHLHSASPDGPMTDLFGRVVAPVSPSRVSASTVRRSMTSAISGPSGATSSATFVLQTYLENRLRAATDLNGSPEFALTWKHQDMPSGRPILRLGSSPRPTSVSGYGLRPWATPKASDGEKAGNLSLKRKAEGRQPDNLPGQMRAHWGRTVDDGAPCPEHPCWLMGYPREFLSCAPSETLSSRKSRRRSSKPR